MQRRDLLGAGLAAPLTLLHALPARASDDAFAWLRRGGVVLAMRHALAPGTFDPPEFRVGDCRTQRNLSEEGRAQARRAGERLRAAGLQPSAVRTSPWCRCVDTATLAFGRAEPWAALGSPRGADRPAYDAHQAELRQALAAAGARREGFEVWVTHMFVLSDLARTGTSSAEGLVLRAGADGQPEVVARLAPA
jgi:phosphohistidine phosphatase SixA